MRKKRGGVENTFEEGGRGFQDKGGNDHEKKEKRKWRMIRKF
jgi:hypothetical protein